MSKISRADSEYSRALVTLYTQAKLRIDGSDNGVELLKAAKTFVLVAAFTELAAKTGAELKVRLNEEKKRVPRLGDKYFYGSALCDCDHLIQMHALYGKNRCLEKGCKCKGNA